MDVVIIDPVRQVVDPRPLSSINCARKNKRRRTMYPTISAVAGLVDFKTGQSLGPVVNRIAQFLGAMPQARGKDNIPPDAERFLKNSRFSWTQILVLHCVQVEDLPKLRTKLLLSDANDRVCWAKAGGTMVRTPPFNEDVSSFTRSLMKRGYKPTLLTCMHL